MPKLHRSWDLRIIPQDTADAMIAVKPLYELLDCREELDDINKAENTMSSIDGDFSINDWLNSLDSDKKERIMADSPIFFLLEARDSGHIHQINRGVTLSDNAIKAMIDIDSSAIDLLRDNSLIEEVYPENTELPVSLWESYQEMDSGPRPAGAPRNDYHLMQRLFHDNFDNGQWESSFDEVVESLPEDNQYKQSFKNRKEVIMNFIKLVHDYDNIFKTISKNQNNG